MTAIEQLLRNGASAEDLIKEVRETKIRIEKERAKEILNKEKLTKARTSLLSAFVEYFNALGIEVTNESFTKNSEDYLKTFEKALAGGPVKTKHFGTEDLITSLFNL